MILSDGSIRKIPGLITPFDEKKLQPASYDLTLGDILGGLIKDNLMTYMLPKGEFILASTLEYVNLPNYLAGRIEGKSSLARKGIIVHTTAGFVDPGFRGELTLELSNLSDEPFPIEIGMPIAQIAFILMDQPAERPYGTEGLDSHYQDQIGPTPSWL